MRIHKGFSLPCAFTRDASLLIVVHSRGVVVRNHKGLSLPCAFTRDASLLIVVRIHEGLSCALQEIVIAVRIYKECIPVHCRAFTRGCRAHSQGIVIAVRIYKGCIPANCRARSRGIVVRIHKGLSLPCAFTRNASLIIVVRIHRQAGCKTLVAWQAQVPCCSANAWCAAVQMHGLLQCKCMVFCSANA